MLLLFVYFYVFFSHVVEDSTSGAAAIVIEFYLGELFVCGIVDGVGYFCVGIAFHDVVLDDVAVFQGLLVLELDDHLVDDGF